MPLAPVITYAQFTSTEVTFLAALADLAWQNGDIFYYNNGPKRLAIGSSAQILVVNSGLPAWAGSSSGITGTFNLQATSTGIVNGSNAVFTFASTIGTILLNGQIQQPGGVDVTLNSSTQVTFKIPPAPGSVVLNLYLT